MKTKEEILKGMSFPEFNMRCVLSFKFFVENLIGVTSLGGVQKYHQEWVESIGKNTYLVIEAATGHAKTTVIGVWHTIWWCWKYKNQDILILSATLEQARKVFKDIKDVIQENPFLVEMFGDSHTSRVWNDKLVHTKEGNNKIRCVPYSSSRGYRSHLTYCDEIDVWEKPEYYFDDVLTRSHDGGKVICTSTPKNSTNLLYLIKTRDEGVNEYAWIKTPAITRKDGTFFEPKTFSKEDFKDAVPTWPEAFPMEKILKQWKTQGRFNFISQQLVTILGETENAPFTIKNLYECYDQKLAFSHSVNPNGVYFIGADFANSEGEKADYTVYTVIEVLDGVITLKYIKKLPKGTKTPYKVDEMQILYDKFNKYGTCRIVADATNIGTEIIPKMRMIGMSVIEQGFQWTLRREMIQTCSNIIQTGSEYIRIPKKNGPEYINEQSLIDEMQGQLAGFLLVKTEAGNENYKSKAPHDDIAISFMMALVEASKMLSSNVSPIIYKKGQQMDQNPTQLVKVCKEENKGGGAFRNIPQDLNGLGYNPTIQPSINSLVRINPKRR